MGLIEMGDLSVVGVVRNNISCDEMDQRPIDCIGRGTFGTRQYWEIIIISRDILAEDDSALCEFPRRILYRPESSLKYMVSVNINNESFLTGSSFMKGIGP